MFSGNNFLKKYIDILSFAQIVRFYKVNRNKCMDEEYLGHRRNAVVLNM